MTLLAWLVGFINDFFQLNSPHFAPDAGISDYNPDSILSLCNNALPACKNEEK